MICLHCNRDILAYQDRTHVAAGGYTHTECFPAYKQDQGGRRGWLDTVLAILVIVGVVAMVWLLGRYD
jgi:hypothetical protein